MRIDDHKAAEAAASRAGRAAENREVARLHEARARDPKSGSTSDRVEISDLAGQVTKVLEAHAAERAKLVRKFAQEVESGRYRADAAATSAALVRESLEAGR
ncbi:MAG: hypothetical protein FJW37_00530 [Acidobacteria bacterium]|nr:hypothetical protein [Acidobacteriota bacterium]